MASFDISILKTITILYVEDEAGLREQELKAYSKLFKNVFPCKDGEDAWEQYKENQDTIDIIITDINMPRLSGLELLKRVIEISNIPFILTTAHQDSEYLLEAIELGVKKYITKPINIKNVVEDIQSVVTQDRKENQIKNIAKSLLLESKHTEKQLSDLLNENRNLKRNIIAQRNLIDRYVSKLTTSKNGDILSVTHKLCELLNYSEIELLSKNIALLQDDSCKNGTFQKQMLNVIHKKETQSSLFVIKDKNNKTLNFIIDTSSTYDSNGFVDSYEYYFTLNC